MIEIRHDRSSLELGSIRLQRYLLYPEKHKIKKKLSLLSRGKNCSFYIFQSRKWCHDRLPPRVIEMAGEHLVLGLLCYNLAPLLDQISGFPISWESPERHRMAGGGEGGSPPAACKSHPVANKPIGWLLHCRELTAGKTAICNRHHLDIFTQSPRPHADGKRLNKVSST